MEGTIQKIKVLPGLSDLWGIGKSLYVLLLRFMSVRVALALGFASLSDYVAYIACTECFGSDCTIVSLHPELMEADSHNESIYILKS